MIRRILFGVVVAALFLGVFAPLSQASITFRLEQATITEGSTTGEFHLFIDVDDIGVADSGILIKGANFSFELGVGTLGGGGGAADVTFLDPITPAVNPLIPGATPSSIMNTGTTMRAAVIDAGGISYPAAANAMGAKRIVTIPYTLGNAAQLGESIPLVFNNVLLPFNNITDSADNFRTNSAAVTPPPGTVILTPGSIMVVSSAVPEPGSMLALTALCVVGGARQYRKKRKAKSA